MSISLYLENESIHFFGFAGAEQFLDWSMALHIKNDLVSSTLVER